MISFIHALSRGTCYSCQGENWDILLGGKLNVMGYFTGEELREKSEEEQGCLTGADL